MGPPSRFTETYVPSGLTNGLEEDADLQPEQEDFEEDQPDEPEEEPFEKEDDSDEE